MKHFIYVTITLFLCISCADSKKKNPKGHSIKSYRSIQVEEPLNLEKDTAVVLKEWVNYYKNLEPSFSLQSFEFTAMDTLKVIPGNVYASFDADFDRIYSKFLVYQNNKEKYIDFDSYNWTANQNGDLIFSPDQEINLVDLNNKSVQRLAFRGPSQWVENIFWENDSLIVLLENNYERQPVITKIHLRKKSIATFTYHQPLSFDSDYFKLRFKKKGYSIK
jgi:hypothetical protein